ncbi:MAG: hypothetical protein SCK28_12430 [Bacillota bacterium]|nr:hypothetical protein [Bacillota bacterium]
MKKTVTNMMTPELEKQLASELAGMVYTKNFRSASAEEWYLFLPSFKDPQTGGAAGKVIIHYGLYGNREVFINTTIIFNDPALHEPEQYQLVYGIADELVNRLVGYADTLLAVHAGQNSFSAEYIEADS